ncbi:hypothetical protein [Maribacter sp. 2304DJ31-5]|uniref:hypothetical protein n=1 Tax=Maribacter sp. 2304DJ31-5 TaxID=3386273 RepID=UPI0039BD3287
MVDTIKKTKLIILQITILAFALPNAEAQGRKLLRKADFSSEIKDFKRSSLLTLMVETPKKEKLSVIKSIFQQIPIPEKFNDHSLDISFIPLAYETKDQSRIILKKLKEAQIAKKMVAKWFNRTKKGAFNLNLVKDRGLYNASSLDIHIAKNTLRGNAMLEDAGEHLISNSFIVVNDYKYTNKEEVMSKGKLLINDISKFVKTKTSKQKNTIEVVDKFAKGYIVKATSYLYRLIWNQEIAAKFYGELWATHKNYDKARVNAFNKTDIFKLEYIGKQDSWADVQSTKYTLKSDNELIERATIKVTDAAISKLERKFEVFRTKTPLISIDPLAAEIGSKEGLTKGDKFEVLEQILQEDGTVTYQKITEIIVDPNQIWDNSYLPEEVPKSDLEYSVFKGNSKKLYPGMLLRFKKNQNIFK